MDENSLRSTHGAARSGQYAWPLLFLFLVACTSLRFEPDDGDDANERDLVPKPPERVVTQVEHRREDEALLVTAGDQGLRVISRDGLIEASVDLGFEGFESARVADVAFDPWGDRVLVVLASAEVEGSAVLSVAIESAPWRFGEVTEVASSDGRIGVLALRSGAVLFEDAMGTRARFLPRSGEAGASVVCPIPMSLDRGRDGDSFIATGHDGELNALVRIDAVASGDRLTCARAPVAEDAPSLGIASIAGEEWMFEVAEGELLIVDEMANRLSLGVRAERVEQVSALDDKAFVLVPDALLVVSPPLPTATATIALGAGLSAWDHGPHRQLAFVAGRAHVATDAGVFTGGQSVESAPALSLVDATVRAPIETIW